MGSLSVSHWLIVLVVLVLLFGSAKLPKAARSLGRSMRIFKSETKGLIDDEPAPTVRAEQIREDAAQLESAERPQLGAASEAVPEPSTPKAERDTRG